MRIVIRNSDNSKLKSAEIKRGVLLTEVLRREGMSPDLPCGGMGRCGKCKVKFIEGASSVTDADRRNLSEAEIDAGFRLACRAVLTNDCEIKIPEGVIIKVDSSENIGMGALAIDIGTTTIATAKKTVMNHQRFFGADVVSRIKAANEGKGAELKEAVLDDIKSLMPEKVSEIILAGNTTMMHLLLGDSCEGLGKAPYTPVRLSYSPMNIADIFHDGEKSGGMNDGVIRFFPGISAFVGADIVSGMYALDFDRIPKGETCMLIDLGTNGEMAVADSEKITVCSTAAGPVFEGGGISCGMAGIPGAIEHVTISTDSENKIDSVDIEVIGGADPVGICGSGVLEMVSELRRCGIIDDTGLLNDDYFEDGFPIPLGNRNINFTQNDIRALQLAKAAIRSGIDTLLEKHGCRALDVTRVYLAGGFSEHLDPEKIKYIKMLPLEFLRQGVLVSAGNTSLLGCMKALGDPEYEKRAINIVEKALEIPLANTDTFGDAFIEAMNF